MDSSSLRAYGRHAAGRLIFAFVSFLLLLSLDFYFVQVAPGDPAVTWLRSGAGHPLDPSLVERVRQDWGLDQPLLVRYVLFLSNNLRGNLGISFFEGDRPVWDVVMARLPNTLVVFLLAALVAAAVGIVLGRIAGGRKGKLRDSVAVLVSLVTYSIPISVLALAFFAFFRTYLPSVPVNRYSSIPAPQDFGGQLADRLAHFVVPVSVAALCFLGFFVLAVRDSVPTGGEATPGRGSRISFLRRLLRALVEGRRPLLRTASTRAGWMLGSILMYEILLAPDGLGGLVLRAFNTGDLPLLSGVFATVSLTIILVVTVAEILAHDSHQVAAPRDAEGRLWSATAAGSVGACASAFRRPLGFVAAIVLLVVIGLAAAAPVFVGLTPLSTSPQRFLPPSDAHPLGTNFLGQDLWALLLYGGRMPLWVGFVAFLFALLFGLAVVASIGFAGGWLGRIVSWTFEFLLLYPWLPFLVLFALLSPSSSFLGFLVPVAVASWTISGRGLALDLRQARDRPDSAWLRGAGVRANVARFLRLFWTFLPRCLGVAFAAASFAVLLETLLAFAGLVIYAGPSTSVPPSWGGLLYDAFLFSAIPRGAWWELLPPAVGILATVFALAALGHVLRYTAEREGKGFTLATAGSPADSAPTGANA